MNKDLHIYINNEEVVCDKNITINEEMLSTSSTILKNCFPKAWEGTKDYVSNFYFPKDYSKCKIFNEIYNPEIPGSTVSGSNLSINYDNTLNYEIEELKGNTTQNGTPTPSSPIPINNVTGLQTITISNSDNTSSNTYEVNLGKNLLDVSQCINGYINSSGIWSGGDNNLLTPFIPVIPGCDYTISLNTQFSNIGYALYNASKTYISRKNNSNKKTLTISIPNDIFYIKVWFNYSGYTTMTPEYILQYEPMIEKGSTATSYSPYFTPIELNKIGDYEDYIRKSTGKNLFSSEIELGNITGTGAKEDSTTRCRTKDFISIKPNTTYSLWNNKSQTYNLYFYDENKDYLSYLYVSGNSFTTPANAKYVMFLFGNVVLDILVMLNEGSTALPYEPYGKVWYVEKNTRRLELAIADMDNSENYPGWLNQTQLKQEYPNTNDSAFNIGMKYYSNICEQPNEANDYIGINSAGTGLIFLRRNKFGNDYTQTYWKTNYPNLVFTIIYSLQTPEITEITNEKLINQLESIRLLKGINNISVISPNEFGLLQIHYNYKEAYTTEDLIFCGVVKNTGNISLNPRDPHYVDLQVLDFKTLLSEGETLNYVITGKTITEAIEQVVSSISDYGFIVGNINILTPDDIINAYSTLNKTAYDVFQYIADITQSKWFTRVIDENTIAIDFYDPTLMPQATKIEYTKEYFEDNDIEDMTFNYSTNDYRNKQIMTSDGVYANITQTETSVSNGYQDSYMCQNKIGIITSITVNGVSKTFATKSEVELGASADFEYQPGEMTFTSNTTYSAGSIIIITYYPIVRGREIVLNNEETSRIQSQINRKGTISRYENRNDTTSSQELIKIGQSYIKYKGKAEITLKIITSKNLFNVGQIVEFDAPLEDLSNEYMVKSKTIEIITTIDQVFYTYELSSNFNSENAINYFDNQRAKSQGNIGEGETIARAIDIESTALIKFYDTTINEVEVSNPTSLDFALDGVLI